MTALARRGVVFAFVLSALAGSALAQAGRGGARGGVPVIDTGPRPAQFSGRVIVDSTRQTDDIIEIRIESAGGSRLAYAYTKTSGEFDFRPVVLEPNGIYYVIVEYEGHLQFRERLDQIAGIGGGRMTIFLSRAPVDDEPRDRAAGNVVDVRQLAADIPEEAHTEYERAMDEVRQGRYSSAIPRLERAVELAPDFYEAQNALGGQYVRLQRFDDAREALERARDLSPGSPAPMVNLGVLNFQEGQALKDGGDRAGADENFRDAVQALEEAIRREPLSGASHYYLGAALYELDDLGRAQEMLDRALELDSESGEPRLVLINVFIRQRRYDAALDQIVTYLAGSPDSPMRPSLEQVRAQIESALRPQQP